MNKLVALVVGGVVVVGGATAIIISQGDKDDTVKLTNSTTGQSQEIKTGSDVYVAVDACDVLTESVAKKVLGDGATKGETSAGNTSSDDVTVSNCVYTYKPVTTGSALQQAQSTQTASVLVRAAKTKTGADSNNTPFTSAKPQEAQDVSGYGDKAYWNPAMSQLNILKNHNWYIMSVRKGLSSNQSTLDDVKVLADELKPNLK